MNKSKKLTELEAHCSKCIINHEDTCHPECELPHFYRCGLCGEVYCDEANPESEILCSSCQNSIENNFDADGNIIRKVLPLTK